MLTANLRQMHHDFVEWVHSFLAVSYDILDVDGGGFDEDFYRFRGQVKELEHRIAYEQPDN